jgi:hypothetical protein
MANDPAELSDSAGPSRSAEAFLALLQTAAHPSPTSSPTSDELAVSLGIAGLPSKQEALDALEKEMLEPVRAVAGNDLWRWQV